MTKNQNKKQLNGKEVKKRKKRGYDAERELVKELRDAGFMALRIPVSAPSSEPLPDVFAVKGNTILAIEVKSQEGYAYFKERQIDKLNQFLSIHKIYPKRFAILAAKFKRRGWSFIIAKENKDYSLKKGGGLSLKNFLKNI